MKFFEGIFVISVVQLLSLVNSKTVSSTTAAENFLEFYENKLNLMAGDLCENFKNLSDQLLNDKFNDSPVLTPEIKDLQQFLEQFLRDYPHFKRYQNFQPFLSLIIQTADLNYINKYVTNPETQMKFKKIFRKKFATLLQKYTETYKRFLKKYIIPKLEDLKRSENFENKQQFRDYKKLMETIKNCQEFSCFPTTLDAIVLALSSNKDLLMDYTLKDYKKFLNIIFIGTYNRSKLLLKDDLILQLSWDIRENLSHDILDFMTIFENNNDTEQFVLKVKENLNLPKKYYRNTKFLAKDQKILKEIFTKYTPNWPEITKYEIGMKLVLEKLGEKMALVIVTQPETIPSKYQILLKYTAF